MNAAAKYLSVADIPVDRDLAVVLDAPFRGFANRRAAPEIVMCVVSVDRVLANLGGYEREPNGRAAVVGDYDFRVSTAFEEFGRPWSLKFCGEGYIRIERQLGRDLFAWSRRAVALYRGRVERGRSDRKPHDYIAVRPMSPRERAAAFGVLA